LHRLLLSAFLTFSLQSVIVARYELVNVVGGGSLGTEIDLYTAVSALNDYNPSYEPEQSPGLHFKLPSTKVTAMIFRTGEYHLTGAESVDQIGDAGNELSCLIETELDLHLNPTEPDVRNLVYVGNIGQEVRLEALLSELDGDVLYEPSTHASLQYRKKECGGVIMLYSSGSYTYTGSGNQLKSEQCLESFNNEMSALLD